MTEEIYQKASRLSQDIRTYRQISNLKPQIMYLSTLTRIPDTIAIPENLLLKIKELAKEELARLEKEFEDLKC